MNIVVNFLKSRHPVSAWLVLLALCTGSLLILNKINRIHTWNQLVDQPERGSASEEVFPDEVLFARAYAQNQLGDYQRALRTYNQIEQSGKNNIKNRVRYNMGSIYLQQAAKLWNDKGVWEYNQINTLLDLAEQSFRKVLLEDSANWQARFNLEYALRIRPPAKEQEESDWTGQKTSVHAILPGIPSGGP